MDHMPSQSLRGHVLPAQVIELSEVDGKPVSWMETARTGKFVSNRYGRFQITEKDLSDAEKNINKANGTVPVDYDHLIMHVSKPGDGIAAGWFQKAELRNGGKQLFGLIEWTPRAAEHIRNREYRFCSPVVVPNYVDNETEEKLGTHIACAAITNMPFIRGMQPLELSTSGELMLADVEMNEKQQRISSAFYEKFAQNSLSEDMPYIIAYYDDYVVARKAGKLFKQNYSITEDLAVTFTGDAVEVVASYTELSENLPMADPKTEVKPDQGALELRQKYDELDSTVKLLSSRLEASEQEAKTERDKRIALENVMKKRDAETLVLSLIKGGKLAKKQQDWAQEYALNDPEGFQKFSQNLDPIVAVGREHGSGEDDERVDRPADPVAQMMTLCNDYIKENGGKDKVKWGEAMRAVSTANPDLATEYRNAFVIKGTPGVN
jgi:phage I-like protein